MDRKERIYFNRCRLLSAKLATSKSGEHKLLKLKFDTPTKKEGTEIHWATLFLNEKNNERNRETLQTLGVSAPPAVCSYDELAKTELVGLGSNVVDLVAEQSGEYMNIKFVNEPRWGVKVYPDSEL